MIAATTVDVRGIDRVRLLVALYNGTAALGVGLLFNKPGDLSIDVARTVIEHHKAHLGDSHHRVWLDYVAGRPIKTAIFDDDIDPRLYDRDAGKGAFAAIVAALRAEDARNAGVAP